MTQKTIFCHLTTHISPLCWRGINEENNLNKSRYEIQSHASSIFNDYISEQACGGCVECVWIMAGTCKYPQRKRNLYYTIRGELIASAQATAAIDWSCPAFIGHDKLCLRWDLRSQHAVLKCAGETLYMCWRVFSVILTEALMTLKCNSF